MTPEEKAEQLVDDYYWELENDYKAKQCALVAVDEIINIIDAEDQFILYNYWLQVKTEIEQS